MSFRRQKFSFPGGDGDTKPLFRHEKPILSLPEPESALHGLLCLAYLGIYTFAVVDVEGLVAAHQAAHKYKFIYVRR